MIRTSVIINITTDITIELENLFDELTVFGTLIIQWDYFTNLIEREFIIEWTWRSP